MSAARSILCAFALLCAAAAAPASAGVLSEDALAGTSLELGAILRSYGFVMSGDVLRPPLAAEDASPLGVGVSDLRFYFADTRPALKLVVHAPVTVTSSSAAMPGVAIGQGLTPPRWLPLRAELADSESVQLVGEVDWLYAAYMRGPVTVTAGRQPVSFGRAKIWRPQDLFGPFSLTQVDTEYKRGVDAVRLDWLAADATSVTVVASAGELEADHDLRASLAGSAALARIERGIGLGELGAIAGYVRGDVVVGVDAVIDAGTFDVYGEGTATLLTGESLSAPGLESGDVAAKAAVGASFRPAEGLTLGPELLYNGFGATDLADEPGLVASPRVAIGEQVTFGTLHAGGVAGWEITPTWMLGGLALVNATDQSALLSFNLRYSVASNAAAKLGGYLPLGDEPDAITAQPATEYGLYPKFLYLELEAIL